MQRILHSRNEGHREDAILHSQEAPPGFLAEINGVTTNGQDLSMACLKGFPGQYENIMITLDALDDDSTWIFLEMIKNHLLQIEH